MRALKVLRWILWPFSLVYGSLMEVRNFLFRIGILKSVSFDIPVISVGNISVGGSGKTPMVKYLIAKLSNEYKIGVLSRGYGRRTKGFYLVNADSNPREVGDEPLEIKNNYPNIVVAVHEDRVLGITELLAQHLEVNLILLDDAFQHQYVKPSFSIVLSTEQNPFYKDFVMPMGRLREFRYNINRCDVVVFTKSTGKKMESRFLHGKTVMYSSLAYDKPELVYGESVTIENPLIVSGLANNQLFFDAMLEAYPNAKTQSYSDHYIYRQNDLVECVKLATSKTIITTEKDWVKWQSILQHHPQDITVYVQKMHVQMQDENQLLTSIKKAIHG